MGHWESNPRREMHSTAGLFKKKGSNEQSNFTLKGLEQQTKPKGIRRKELMKIRAEISEIESKKLVQNINESQS